MQYKRALSDKILLLASQVPAIVLSGARQTGKTTLLKNLFSTYNYVSLDLPSIAELAENDPETFLSKYKPPLIIDEIQYAPKLFRFIKIAIDNNRDANGQFILAGSQKFVLMKEISDSLAGRAIILNLATLSYEEIIKTNPMFKDKINLLIRGGFPELWKNTELNEQDYLRSYISTYIERDVRQILNVSNLRDFERFIRICASRSGNLLNKTEISKKLGLSSITVNKWLSVLEASNQIILLEPFYSNISKRIVKTPKLYFTDIGLLCFLLGVDKNNIETNIMLGNIWETFIHLEIRKTIINSCLNINVYFYQDKQANEIDFILQHGSKLMPVECKWTQYPEKRDADKIDKICSFLNYKNQYLINKQLIACRTLTDYPLSKTTTAIDGYSIFEHVHKFLV